MSPTLPSRAPLAPTLVLLALAAPAYGATIPVTTCADSGPGSLRNAAAVAQDGDVIDLRGLACSRILLTSGPVIFDQFTVTLQGPGHARLAIDGGNRSAVLRHHITGTGGSGRLIRIRDLTVRWGRLETTGPEVYGACIYSGGSVELERVHVHHCTASGARYIAGAGVAARRNLRLIRSEVYANRAVHLSPSAVSYGGGAYGGWRLLLDHSRVCGNQAQEGGGGATAELTSRYSTVSHNTGGGMTMTSGRVESSTFSHNTGYGLLVSGGVVMNSTFSSNRGPGLIVQGGAFWQNTVAYNVIPRVDGVCRGGIDVQNAYIQLRGNLSAYNTCDGIPLDLRAWYMQTYSPTSRNLVMYSRLEAGSESLPPDTLTADPRLLPLADNGGPTLTHALRPDSPALDRGSSAEVGPYDQRGPGFQRRVRGYADIGAYELQSR